MLITINKYNNVIIIRGCGHPKCFSTPVLTSNSGYAAVLPAVIAVAIVVCLPVVCPCRTVYVHPDRPEDSGWAESGLSQTPF